MTVSAETGRTSPGPTDLTFVHRKRRVRATTFGSESGAGIIGLPVPVTFRSS